MNRFRSTYQPNWAAYGPVSTRPTPYEVLLRQSRLLGRAAARANNNDVIASFCVLQGPPPPAGSPSSSATPPGGTRSEKEFYEQNPDDMHRMAAQSREVLAGARTVPLPYNIFPDTVTVDRMKVTINLWEGLWSHRIVTLRIEDILNVAAQTGVLFGSLTISTRVMNSTDHFVIVGFWNKDVRRLKQIIQGYMIALHQGIDVSNLSTERLVRKLNELGSDARVVK